MVTFNSIKKAHFVSSLIKKKTALHNLNKQRPKEFPMQKMLEALFNKFIYLPREGKLWWVFTELQVNLSPHLFTNFNWLFYSN